MNAIWTTKTCLRWSYDVGISKTYSVLDFKTLYLYGFFKINPHLGAILTYIVGYFRFTAVTLIFPLCIDCIIRNSDRVPAQ